MRLWSSRSAAPDGFLPVVIDREVLREPRAMQAIAGAAREPADPQHAVPVLDPIVQHHQFFNQLVAGDGGITQLQDDAIDQVLIQGRGNAGGK